MDRGTERVHACLLRCHPRAGSHSKARRGKIGRASCRERGESGVDVQEEDGIRDGHVTGVQTCALPISPATPIEPVTEVLHGVEITDPYRWLEDQNSPRTRKWIEEQSAYTRAYFDAIPGRDRIRKRVEERSEERRVGKEGRAG